MKRSIKPHKGGRTANLSLRLTPDEKQAIIDQAETEGINVVELIIKSVAERRRQYRKGRTMKHVHEWKFNRRINGDEINHANGHRTELICECGKTKYGDDELSSLLVAIKENDTNYDIRYKLVLKAVAVAAERGFEAGFAIDPTEPDWPVAFIELPTGQVSWHMPAHPRKWDGHTTEEKFSRLLMY